MTPLPPIATGDEDILDRVLDAERGFSNNPADRGGPTNWGLTQADVGELLGHPATVDDVRALTRDQAKAFLAKKYAAPFWSIVPTPLRGFMIDSAVNCGVAGAWKLLQEALGVAPDGIPGPKTYAALDAKPWRIVLARAIADRYTLYARIVVAHPSDITFIVGWFMRLEPFLEDLA